MGRITINDLDDGLVERLYQRAAGNGRTAEEEAREILGAVLDVPDIAPEKGLGTAINNLFKPFGGVELELPPRGATPKPPKSE